MLIKDQHSKIYKDKYELLQNKFASLESNFSLFSQIFLKKEKNVEAFIRR